MRGVPGLPAEPCGSSLLAKAVDQLEWMLNVLTYSRAGSLPQLDASTTKGMGRLSKRYGSRRAVIRAHRYIVAAVPRANI